MTIRHVSELVAALLVSLAPGLTLGACSDEATCVVEGRSYEVGESYPAPDGCNTCTCEGEDSTLCTRKGCLDGCRDGGGTFHERGTSFPAPDGCNACSCGESGLACTEEECDE